jgi:chemotaxis signal transduction protein
MTDDTSRWCVLIPCSNAESWAVPQNCLAEIVTLHDTAELPPEELNWRGVSVPVMDFGYDDGSPWRERRGGAGLIAIFLGLEGEGCDYWGVAIRGQGLAVRRIAAQQVEDAPEAVRQHATAAFKLDGAVYQVPDLALLQKKIAASLAAA